MYDQNTALKGSPELEKSEIHRQFEQLEKEVACLGELAVRLDDKLSVVCLPLGPAIQGGPGQHPEPVRSTFSSGLQRLTNQLVGVRQRLDSVFQRLEL